MKFSLAPLLFAAVLATASARDKTLDIYWIDSEGGGSTLLVTPAGESILVDTGNPGGRDPQRIAKVAKDVAGLTRLDHVIISHFHIDHFGGLAELPALIPVGVLYDKGFPEGSPDGKPQDLPWSVNSKRYLGAQVGKRVVLAAGDTVPLRVPDGSPALQLRCLGANQRFIDPTPGQPQNPLNGTVPAKPVDSSDNANSIVLLLQFGDFRFFNGGDLSWNSEAKLVSSVNLVGLVDLYQVNHHGLEASNNPLLIRSLEPTVAVMNNGPTKGTGKSAMDALRSIPGIQIYQIHENIREDKENTSDPNLIANHGNLGDSCAAHYIQCTVAADAKHYTLKVPSTGHALTYVTRPRLNWGE